MNSKCKSKYVLQRTSNLAIDTFEQNIMNIPTIGNQTSPPFQWTWFFPLLECVDVIN